MTVCRRDRVQYEPLRLPVLTDAINLIDRTADGRAIMLTKRKAISVAQLDK
jgi:hypothetical protein